MENDTIFSLNIEVKVLTNGKYFFIWFHTSPSATYEGFSNFTLLILSNTAFLVVVVATRLISLCLKSPGAMSIRLFLDSFAFWLIHKVFFLMLILLVWNISKCIKFSPTGSGCLCFGDKIFHEKSFSSVYVSTPRSKNAARKNLKPICWQFKI